MRRLFLLLAVAVIGALLLPADPARPGRRAATRRR